jgi:hypothetical protein
MKVIKRSGLVFAAASVLIPLARLMLLMTKEVLRNPNVLVLIAHVVSMASYMNSATCSACWLPSLKQF